VKSEREKESETFSLRGTQNESGKESTSTTTSTSSVLRLNEEKKTFFLCLHFEKRWEKKSALKFKRKNCKKEIKLKLVRIFFLLHPLSLFLSL
jgi:hypothetical protein